MQKNWLRIGGDIEVKLAHLGPCHAMVVNMRA